MTETQQVLTPEEGKRALKLVRESLETYVRTGTPLRVDEAFTGGLGKPCGAFVTIHTDGDALRGCIGHMVGDGPLGKLLVDLAVKSGTEDPRFPPVRANELDALHYEISVLSPMRKTPAADVTPGVHGLLVRMGSHSGVLLPQVAVEWGWDREEFLAQTCSKAGLPKDAWRDSSAEIRTFTAQIFSEGQS